VETVGQPFTLLDDGRPVRAPARLEAGGMRLSPAAATALTGHTTADAVELVALARRLERPLALDVDERAAYLGVSAAERARRLASLEAPDFALPDLEGRLHTLAEHCGKKVLLVAYASW
jgi:hypothetical protein